MITILVLSSDGSVLASSEHPEEALLSVDRVYQPGDVIRITGASHLRVQMDQSLLGGGDTLYMNDSGVYVMGSRWKDDVTRTYTESVYTVEEHVSGSETEIWRFSLADGLKLSANGTIPGYLESQFSCRTQDKRLDELGIKI